MNIIGYVVFFSAVPIILLAFAMMPARRAVVASTVGCWLFLPYAAFPLPGLPDYTKASALAFGLLLGTILFAPAKLMALRFRWYDVPIAAYCLVAFASGISNDLGPYTAASSFLSALASWGIPYLIGRIYFGDDEGLRELAIGMVAGGVIYIPLCLYEIRMSPQLHHLAYGYTPQGPSLSAAIRWGGYRPVVFMLTGLEVGLFMAAVTVVAYGLWTAGAVRKVLGVPTGWIFASLLVTTVLCKSTGATALVPVGIGALWLSKRAGTLLPFWCLAFAAPLFLALRLPQILDLSSVINWITQNIDADRGSSLEFRIRNEDLIMIKAWQRPLLGWGGFARGFVYDENGLKLSTVDSLWMVLLSGSGLAGVVSLTAVQVLPFVLWLSRRAKQPWWQPTAGGAAAVAVGLALWTLDNLVNAMYNPMYLVIAGGLMGWSGPPIADMWRRQAELARALKHEGRPVEAATAWARAIRSLGGMQDSPRTRRARADIHNDLAWILCIDPASAAYDPDTAVRHAEAALNSDPDHAAAWNTKGLALFRRGDFAAAIRALDRSVERAGGTGFDSFPLAMAHHHMGHGARAARCLDEAIAWTRSHNPSHPELLGLWNEAARVVVGDAMTEVPSIPVRPQ